MISKVPAFINHRPLETGFAQPVTIEDLRLKLNEIIDVVNVLMEAHPKAFDRAHNLRDAARQAALSGRSWPGDLRTQLGDGPRPPTPSYNAVASVREIRDRISRETAGMTAGQLNDYCRSASARG